MGSNRRTWKPVAAGVLTLVAGIVALGGGIAIVLVGGGMSGLQLASWIEFVAGAPAAMSGVTILSPLLLGSLGAILIPLGVVAIVAGLESLKRRHWKFCLAGGICAAAVIPVFGLPAVILVALSRREYDVPGMPHDRRQTGEADVR